MSNSDDLIVYTKNNCPQCRFLLRMLDREKLDYRIVRVDKDEDALNHVRALGYSQVPVVEDRARGITFAGLRPERVRALSEVAA